MNYEVTPEQLQDIWPKVRHWIERALEYGTGDEQLSDVFLGIARGYYGLWYSEGEFALVFQIWNYPRQRVGTIVYAGGDDLAAIVRAWDYAQEECVRRGIQMLRMWGRPGWEKILGAKRVGIILQARVQPPQTQSLGQPQELRTMQ